MLCVVVGVADHRLAVVLPFALLVVALEVLADLSGPGHAAAALATEVGVVVVGAAVTAPTTRALLPLLLVPAFRAGEVHGRRAAVRVALALLLAPVAGVALAWRADDGGSAQLVTLSQWWLLAVGLATLSAWNRQVEVDRAQPHGAMAREAGRLLGRLQDLARGLPAGLDAPAVAQILLDDVLERAPAERCAVLVRVGAGLDQLSPVAVRGVERVPWRDPIGSEGTAHQAWTTRRVVCDVRKHDEGGRRHGSALLALPVADRDDELLGLVLVERLDERGFDADEIAHASATVDRLAPHLHAALAFTELRHLNEVAERERLAREMHDGVAQDLSALGFSLDVLARRAGQIDESLAGAARGVRAELNRTIRDIRLSIADLRSSAHPDRGLGAAVSSHVEALAAATGVQVTLSLRESTFRLPSHVEAALLRLIQDFLTDVRGQGDVRQVSVALESDAPTARVGLSREGGGTWTPDAALVAALESRGGSLDVMASLDGVRALLLVNGSPETPGHPDRVVAGAGVEVGA